LERDTFWWDTGMRRLIEVARFVTDVPAAVTFYQDVLQRPPIHHGPGIAVFDLGGVTLLLHERYEPGPDDLPPEDHVAFAVPDVDAAVRELEQRGHTVEVPPRTYPWGTSAYFRDPAGNLVEFHRQDTTR
jgi:catechol 2,3-dioxygenase-like lactoylglutathione lyase family enzyme